MLHHLNNLLRHLFISRIDEITEEGQVRFQPPDQEWRNHVSGLTGNALNVYLVDLRENRKLRSNERTREVQNGIVSETPAPRRMDCHYLITAWSPATVTPAVEPALDEQALLYEVTRVLMNNEPLIPRQVYAPAPLPDTFPEALADAKIPTTILPVEGFPKLAEFWGTVEWRWKPVVYLIVTMPVLFEAQVAGAMVTTRITEYRHQGKPETAEVWVQIAGHVLDASNPLPDGAAAPVSGAWVRLESEDNTPLQTTETDALGRFTFERLQPGTYQLRWRAGAHPEPPPRLIQVPSPTGEYELRFE